MHWQIELLAALLGMAAAAIGSGLEAVAGAMFGWLLIPLAALDAAELWLPDSLTAWLAITGLASGFAGIGPLLSDRVLGGVVGFVGLWSVGAAYRRLRHRSGLGAGDPKLFGAIGCWLGWQMLPAILLLASLLGLGVAAVAMVRGRAMSGDVRLPFGTMLSAAAYAVWLVMALTGLPAPR